MKRKKTMKIVCPLHFSLHNPLNRLDPSPVPLPCVFSFSDTFIPCAYHCVCWPASAFFFSSPVFFLLLLWLFLLLLFLMTDWNLMWPSTSVSKSFYCSWVSCLWSPDFVEWQYFCHLDPLNTKITFMFKSINVLYCNDNIDCPV